MESILSMSLSDRVSISAGTDLCLLSELVLCVSEVKLCVYE